MSWRNRKEVIILTSLLSFVIGLLLLLSSKLYLTTEPWETIARLLGAYLTISVVVNLFHRSFLKPSEDEARRKELETLLDQRINAILSNSTRYGFSGFIPEMDFKNLFRSLERKDTLWWLDTYCPSHELWEDELRCAISRGAQINMLVLSPDSNYAVDRANEIGGTYAPERFKKELSTFKESLEIIKAELKDASGSIEIVEYTDRPSMPAYIVVKRNGEIFGYSSLFLGKPTGVSFPHMKWIIAEASVVQLFLEYVQAKWNRNRSATDTRQTV